MAFTASLLQRTKEGGKERFLVSFTDGVTSQTKEYVQDIGSVDIEGLKRSVASALNDLNNPPVLSVGAIDTTPVVVPPTQAQLDQAAWLKDFSNLRGALSLIEMLNAAGQSSAATTIMNSAAFTNLAGRVANNFKPAYVTFL